MPIVPQIKGDKIVMLKSDYQKKLDEIKDLKKEIKQLLEASCGCLD